MFLYKLGSFGVNASPASPPINNSIRLLGAFLSLINKSFINLSFNLFYYVPRGAKGFISATEGDK